MEGNFEHPTLRGANTKLRIIITKIMVLIAHINLKVPQPVQSCEKRKRDITVFKGVEFDPFLKDGMCYVMFERKDT